MNKSFVPSATSILGSLSLAALSLAVTAPAEAILTFNIQETGTGVTVNASGSVDLTGLTSLGTFSTINAFMEPNLGNIYMTQYVSAPPQPWGNLWALDSAQVNNGDLQFGTGGATGQATSFSGTDLSLITSVGELLLPTSYTSGDSITSTMTFDGATFTSLGITAGTYEANLSGSGELVRIQATAVPLESDALPVVGSALFMAGGLWWKKKRAQAKVANFNVK